MQHCVNMDSLIIDNLIATPDDQETSSSSSDDPSIPSSTSTSEESSNFEYEEDLLLIPLMRYLLSGRKKSRIENYLDTVNLLSEVEFKQHFRLSKYTASILIQNLEKSGFIPSHSFGIKPISAKLSFLMFLWFIANTEPLRTLSDRFNISVSSVFRVLRRVINWLLTKVDEVISWPQDHDLSNIIAGFKRKRGINNVIGTIDSTHIKIAKPKANAQHYCNRKKYFSINLQAVVDSNMRFTNIYCGEPGSFHDVRVFRRSLLYDTSSMDKSILFPNETFILGDSAYPSLPWLVSPFKDI
ncbi:uncharacterized protein [Prorops nasuta]|uniref:uncharacterized protein n=1 Tax=Prorops nasuta TaxID=863751 RepID=UPI0034CDBD97